MNCPNCQTPYEGDNRFCAVCGTARPQDVEATVAVMNEAPVGEEAVAAAPKKKSMVGLIVGIAVVALVAVIAVVALAFVLLGGGGKSHYQIYRDGDDLMMVNTKNGKTATVVEAEDGKSGGSAFVTLDGKRMFYQNGDGDLFYMSTSKPDKEHVKVASEVRRYSVTLNGKKVAYLKDDSLYRSDLENSEKISGDVEDFDMSKDGKYLVYTKVKDEKIDLYIQKEGKDAEKVASDLKASYAYDFFDESYTKLVYINKDGKLYVYDGKEQTKIAEDVTGVASIVTSKGAFYYTVKKEEKKEENAEETTDNYDDFKAPTLEDRVKEEAKELYFYDGKEPKKLTDKYYTSGAANSKNAKAPVFVYKTIAVKGEGENQEIVNETFITFGGSDPVSLGKDISGISIDEDGKKMLYTTSKTTGEGKDAKTKYNLFEVELKSDSLGDTQELVSDAKESIDAAYFDGNLFYVIEEELYVNGEVLISDFYDFRDFTTDGKYVLIAADAKMKKTGEGENQTETLDNYSLYTYKIGAKDVEKVADEVTDSSFDGKKAVCYVVDETLYVDGEKVADDVKVVGGLTYADSYEDAVWAPQL